jgi:hypothetical protein
LATPIGSEFQFNTRALCEYAAPAAALDANGDFVNVSGVGGSSGSDTNDSTIQVQRYDTSGFNG